MSAEAGQEKPRVLIVGAGVSGLLLAQGLNNLNIPYKIIETEDGNVYRPKEWTMGLHWSLPLLKKILPAALATRLTTDAACDPSSPPQPGSALIYDAVSGNIVKDLDPNGEVLRVSRRKLRNFLREGVNVEYNQSLADLTCEPHNHELVTATFTDGSTSTFNLVIGADGPRSTVRRFLVGDEASKLQPFPLESTHMSAVVAYHDAEKARFIREKIPTFALILHPEMTNFVSIQDVPDPEKPETWTFFFFPCWVGKRDPSWDSKRLLEVIKERGEGMAEPFRSALLWIPDDTHFTASDLTFWSPEGSWDTRDGRVTLVGDAAHPMPPYRGQGANHAIQDVHNLLSVLSASIPRATSTTPAESNGSWRTSIQTYTDEVSRRCADEVKLSCKNGIMAMQYDKFFEDSPYMKLGLGKADASKK